MVKTIQRIILLVAIGYTLCFCSEQTSSRKECEFVLNNKELKREILYYLSLTDKYDYGIPTTCHIFYQQINDSIDRFEVMLLANGEDFRNNPYIIKACLNNKDVFLHYGASSKMDNTNSSYLVMTDRAYENILKEYYPKQYDEYLSNRNRRIKKSTIVGLDSPTYILCFRNGMLYSKQMLGLIPK